MRSIVTVLNQTEPVCYDLTTVEAANTALGIVGDTVKNAQTADQITDWSKIIATYCNRVFAKQTVQEIFMSVDDTQLRLSRYPVTEIVSVSIGDQEIDSATYEVDPTSGLLYRVDWSNWYGRITVVYTGGYELPDGAEPLLKKACIEMMKISKWTAKRDSTVRDLSAGDKRVSYSAGTATDSIIPVSIASMIAPFVRTEI